MCPGDEAIVSFASPYRLQDMFKNGQSHEGGAIQHHCEHYRNFNVRMASSSGWRQEANALIQKMYAWRGYSISQPLGKEHNKITLVADAEGKTVGTMTLFFDSRHGLPADENFRDKLDQLRRQNRRLCEPSWLAINEDVPRRVLASLIHVSYAYARNIHGFTDYVIEVHPRHAMFYKRMLGFHDFGEVRVCTRVNAPAVLLRLELEHMAKQIQKFGGSMKQHGGEKSLYPYFFQSTTKILAKIGETRALLNQVEGELV